MRLGRRLTTGIAEDPPAPTPAPPGHRAPDEAPHPAAEAPVTPERVGDPASRGAELSAFGGRALFGRRADRPEPEVPADRPALPGWKIAYPMLSSDGTRRRLQRRRARAQPGLRRRRGGGLRAVLAPPVPLDVVRLRVLLLPRRRGGPRAGLRRAVRAQRPAGDPRLGALRLLRARTALPAPDGALGARRAVPLRADGGRARRRRGRDRRMAPARAGVPGVRGTTRRAVAGDVRCARRRAGLRRRGWRVRPDGPARAADRRRTVRADRTRLAPRRRPRPRSRC